jgi:hypothetical protein
MVRKVGLSPEFAVISPKLPFWQAVNAAHFGQKVPNPEKLKPINRRARRAIKAGRKKDEQRLS